MQLNERITSYSDSGKPVGRCYHKYWQDVSPIPNTMDSDLVRAKNMKMAKDWKALKVSLQHHRVLYSL